MPEPMLVFAENEIRIKEPCSLHHEFQIVELELHGNVPEKNLFLCRDKKSGKHFPVQRSLHESGRFFLGLELEPLENLELELFNEEPEKQLHEVKLIKRKELWELGNGIVAIRIPVSRKYAKPAPCSVPGPVAGIRFRNGAWFGETYFDTLAPVSKTKTELLESGPLRTVIRFQAEDIKYSALFTLDAGQCFIRVEETFNASESDQLVWIFEKNALPPTGYFLDPTPYYETRNMHCFTDAELAKLGPWTQQSQLSLSDGFAFRLPAEDCIFGAVALCGEEWKGNRLNSLDAWMRRLRKGDRLSRRLVPGWAKADAAPGPASELIPERDVEECTPAICWEGWLGNGKRVWGLVVSDKAGFTPPGGDDLTLKEPPLSHFCEDEVSLERFLKQQGLLRKLHTQRGIYPLRKMLGQIFGAENAETDWSFTPDSDFMRHLIESVDSELDPHSEKMILKMTNYIRARVASFWYGAGVISTNPVSSRRVAPFMFLLEELAKEQRIEKNLLMELRSKFLFLAYLFHSQSCYAGYAAMLPPSNPDSFDPSLKGMANQNFYTDIINVYGSAAMIWASHPAAKVWKKDFIAMFSRQLSVHVYPASGVWEESHTYFQHVLLTVLPILKMLKEKGVRDYFKDPQFSRLFHAALGERSIRNSASEDLRPLVAFGDHDASVHPYHLLWHNYAMCFAESDPELAAHLNWLGREAGGAVEPGIAVTAPEIRSEHLAGLGVFFRGCTEGGAETLLAFRSGKSWAHHHQDDGSFQLLAHGRILIGDAGCSGRTSGSMKLDDVGHSRWTVPGTRILNYHWRFNRGWITDCRLDGAIQYATGFSPALMTLCEQDNVLLRRELRHFRSILRLDPEVYLIVDSNLDPVDSLYHFHLATDQFEMDGNEILGSYGNLKLRLTPFGTVSLKNAGIISGNEPRRNMVTTHFCYEAAKTEPYSAFLLRFGNGLNKEFRPEIRMENGMPHVKLGHAELLLRHTV